MSSSTSVVAPPNQATRSARFVARRRRPRRLDREHRLVDRAPEAPREAGARHHAVAVARAGIESGRRAAARWPPDPPRSRGSWRRTRRSPRRDFATAPTVRRQRPRGRSHRRPRRRAPSARCVRYRRASTRRCPCRSSRQRPARDRHRAHRVVVARARGRRGAMTGEIGDDPVGRRGRSPAGAADGITEVVEQYDGHASTSSRNARMAAIVPSGSSRCT